MRPSFLHRLMKVVRWRMVKGSFEIFDHTADAGLRIRAAQLSELIEPATRGLYAMIGELVGGEDAEPFKYLSRGHDAAAGLRDYLASLLLLFETRHRVLGAIEASFLSEAEVSVAGRSFSVDAERSVYFREVKAVTYHELAIRAVPGGFEATVIVDI